MAAFPLDSSSPTYLHLLQNATLISLALSVIPLGTFIAIASLTVAPFTQRSKHIAHHRKWRTISSATFRPRTVLITGVGNSKGLALARTFYRGGHNVIGADFEPHRIPVCGRYSRALHRFYRLAHYVTTPEYARQLMGIVQKEGVELWVSCLEDVSAIVDADVAELVESNTECKTVQFSPSLTDISYEKDAFLEKARGLELNFQETVVVTSVTEALVILSSATTSGKRYTMKNLGGEDADENVLPLATAMETQQHVRRLKPSPFRPLVLQQYLSGPTFRTHSLIVASRVQAFVASPSTNQNQTYTALPASSAISQALLLYEQTYVREMGADLTGHVAFEFVVDGDIDAERMMKSGIPGTEVRELMKLVYPVSCTSRPGMGILLLGPQAEDLAEAYLNILPDHDEPRGIANGHHLEKIITPVPGTPTYYWIGHDLFALFVLPLLNFLRLELGIRDLLAAWFLFIEHIIYGHEALWEFWDPWPALAFYLLYLPLNMLHCIYARNWWAWCDLGNGYLMPPT
ncbi:hypothetical protein BP6252_08565 [Coleophoma cylindrospora]|uniref:ATP-grasp domain-containing protein n=1 Tax=Coleophoma cylindrospora TaxID=1849047 RepID=A0A3D8R674_9HELO|nr:hypothetical protein BP6252_08565 [Coleophoma cylindrospora]